jgi:hypothetical protein
MSFVPAVDALRAHIIGGRVFKRHVNVCASASGAPVDANPPSTTSLGFANVAVAAYVRPWSVLESLAAHRGGDRGSRIYRNVSAMKHLSDFKPLANLILPDFGERQTSGLTVVVGPNSSGKTQLLQDIYQRCSGYPRSLVVATKVQIAKPPYEPFMQCFVRGGCGRPNYPWT